MVINTNLQAQNTAANLQANQALLSKSLARLSSGSKIISPADDAAGMAVAMRMDAQVKRLNAVNATISNAISFTQTQDGFMKKIGKALDRMSELAVMAQDMTKTDTDRTLYDSEFQQLSQYITSAASKDFNGISLFSSTDLQVAMDSDGNTFTMAGTNLSSATYTTATGSNLNNRASASTALTNVLSAMRQLASDRASIGAVQARLNATSEQLIVSKENLAAASSRIQDVDVADESTEFARFNILTQAGTAMLAQANVMPQSVLRLLQ
jgi:flagellin